MLFRSEVPSSNQELRVRAGSYVLRDYFLL